MTSATKTTLTTLAAIGMATSLYLYPTREPEPIPLLDEKENRDNAASLSNRLEASKPATERPLKNQKCNPNYSGCLISGSGDYDCAGGSGNGPHYTGEVRVLGYDEYGLDRNGDGVGCEP